MNARFVAWSLGLVVATACVTTLVARPQDPAKMSPEEMAKMMDAYMKAAEPGEQHEALQELVGEWDVELTNDMMGQTEKSKGTAKFESILGGRYVIETTKGVMGGTPYEGFQILGYDNVLKQHFAVWLDSMGTGVMFMTGQIDPQTGWCELKGTAKDAMSPEGRPCRARVKTESKDKQLMEFYDSMADGKGGFTEMKVMEGVRTRKKSAKAGH